MNCTAKIKVIISGGGTGGHIFPAIAIANTLKIKCNDVDILFVGAKGKMEMEKVAAEGYPIEGLWISGLQRRMTIKNFFVPFKILSSLIKSNKILNRFKPEVVVGVGGYASWSVVKVASIKGIPTLIQEQNSFPGKSNINLSGKVDRICVSFPNMERFFPKSKIVVTGNPIRQEIVNIDGKKDEALNFFDLKPGKKVLLALGGSLGARTINVSIQQYLSFFVAEDIQVIWQTGKMYFETAKEAANNVHNEGIKVFDFINRMDYAYAAADIIVSRAGAISVSELCLVGKPVILVPSPNVAEDHQTKNAEALVKAQAAKLIKDSQCRTILGKTVLDLLLDNDKCSTLSANIKTLAKPNAADAIVEEVLKLAGRK